MRTLLKLQPFSAPIDKTNSIGYKLTGLPSSKDIRVKFENGTFGHDCKLLTLDQGEVKGNYARPESGTTDISGTLDLNVPQHAENSVVSIYANIEAYIGGEWRLLDIAAFAFQIENPKESVTMDKVRVEPAFVAPDERATIHIQTEANSHLRVYINGKSFVIRSNYEGEGSMSFRGIDILGGSTVGGSDLQRFPVTFSKPQDKHETIYHASVDVHYVPEAMRVLQATNDPGSPECAILDPDPGPGPQLKAAEDFCFNGAAVGDLSIFDADSGYVNSRVGFCGGISEITPDPSSSGGVCRIFNSSDTTLLPNGSGLVAFASAYDPSVDGGDLTKELTLASRIFVAQTSTSLKFRGNPVRNGTILEPSDFYHSVIMNNLVDGDTIGIIFRIEDGTVFEIQQTVSGTVAAFIGAFVDAINADERIDAAEIIAIAASDRVDVFSDSRFSIRVQVLSNGTSDVEVCLDSNKTLELLAPDGGFDDTGDTVLFLEPSLGAQSYSITGRTAPNIIRFEVPEGVNNGYGPTITENFFCEKFVVVDQGTEAPEDIGITTVNPLPYIKDKFQREVPSVFPSITARRDFIDGEIYVYCVCQAIVDSVYQLFYFGFKLGSQVDQDIEWTQLTTDGENKNARIECDKGGNLHVVWESDRNGPTQIYYGVLGPNSRALSNQVLMSAIDKEGSSDSIRSLLSITEPTAIQDDWLRILSGSGAGSVSSLTKLAVQGKPSTDGAMAVFTLDETELGEEFNGFESQLSYQVSFDLSMGILSNQEDEDDQIPFTVRTDKDIDALYSTWLSQFTPKQNFRYEIDKNRFTVDRYDPFFEKIIPICGSYNFGSYASETSSPGATVPNLVNNLTASYSTYDNSIETGHPGNLRHFMLALMPEKVRFKALNTEPLFVYLDRNELTTDSSSQYISQIENTYYTGRFKLALVLATSEDESTGVLSKKSHHVVRQFGDYMTFADLAQHNNIKIAVHYTKQPQEAIDNRTKFDRSAVEQDYRFYGNIIVTVGDAAQLGQSFIADFSDRYRKFDIGLGFPSGGQFRTNEQIPYNGNEYDTLPVVQIFDNIAIGPHTVRLNESIVKMSNFDRNTSAMFVSEEFNDLIINGSFESFTAPLEGTTLLSDGDTTPTGWTITNGATSWVEDAGLPSYYDAYDGVRFLELTGLSDSQLGSIAQDVTTEIGKEYVVEAVASYHPQGITFLGTSSVDRKVKISADAVSQTYRVRQESQDANTMRWQNISLRFTATSSITTITFENATDLQAPFNVFGPCIDRIRMYAVEDLPTETNSQNVDDMLLLEDSEYYINYSLNATDHMSQIPITLSSNYQNRNPDLSVDDLDKVHVVWQSNRDGPWEVYYAGSRDRSIPFRFETRITDKDSNSLMPSIGVDYKGRRCVSWHDNRDRRRFQIYSAMSKEVDPQWIDQCKIDMVEEYIHTRNVNYDPYDPYFGTLADDLGCKVVFDFQTDTSGLFHFTADFYTDEAKTTLEKSIDSRDSVVGWRVNDTQLDIEGALVAAGETVTVTYSPDQSDNLSNKLLYVTAKYVSNAAREGEIVAGGLTGNIEEVDSSVVSSVRQGEYQSDNVRIFSEGTFSSPVSKASQTAEEFENTLLGQGGDPEVVFYGSDPLAGFNAGDKVRSYYIHYDRSTSTEGEETVTIEFDSPIVGIYASGEDRAASDAIFGVANINYAADGNENKFGEDGDSLTLSANKRILTLTIRVNSSEGVDDLRVIVAPVELSGGTTDFVYYCPFEQTPRCSIIKDIYNSDQAAIDNVHFRITFYADENYESPILSSFSLFDQKNWISGASDFPANGITIDVAETASIAYDPNILPFDLFDDQKGDTVPNAIQSFFVSNRDGWRVEDPNGTVNATWVSDGGAGAIRYADTDSVDAAFFVAPAKFLGNLEAFYGGTIEASMRLDPDESPSSPQTPTVKIVGSAGTLVHQSGSPPNRSASYETLRFTIDESVSGWEFQPSTGGGFAAATEANIRAVLRNVTSVLMDADFFLGSDNIYMSDFAIRPQDQNLSFDRSLLCGVPYYYKLEQYDTNTFEEIEQGMFLCPCFYTESSIWRKDTDSKNWISSGQGFDDFKVSETDNECLNARVLASETGLFYISWEDYRYTRLGSDQPALSPDYFFAVYDANNDELHSSAQGGFDRRLTYYSDEESGILYNASTFLDQFQNFNIAFHNGTKMYHQACSIGCALESFNPNLIQPCMFTDGTGDSFYQVGGEPDRDISQYQKMRIREPYVAYSTYLDLETPMAVINDCFIELDIVGVPGTYAFRLKNEDDDTWTEWLPIGPSLPSQPNDDADTEEERDFFRAFFIAKDRFIAPWITSPGDGVKRVYCEILTFFGKTEQFYIDFQAFYRGLDYRIDFFFDEEFQQPIPKYRSYPVASTQKTATLIDDEYLTSISEEIESVSNIWARISFPDTEKLQIVERLAALDRYSDDSLTMSVYQQGINDQLNIPLTKISDGLYKASFSIAEDDSVVNVDGLGVVVINIPGQCRPTTIASSNPNGTGLFDSISLDQSVTIFNNLTLFRDKYIEDDMRRSFGDPNYYKSAKFGGPGIDPTAAGGNADWIGGGDGRINPD